MRGCSSGLAAHCWQNNKNAPAVSLPSPGTAAGPGSKHWQLGSWPGETELVTSPCDHLVTTVTVISSSVLISLVTASWSAGSLTGRSSDLRLLCLCYDIDLRLLLPLSAPARPGLRGLGPASANQRPSWGQSDQSEASSGRWAPRGTIQGSSHHWWPEEEFE